MKGKLLTTREVAGILGISEGEIINLANANLVPHFKVGGKFLRFRQEDVLKIKPAIKKKYHIPEKQYPRLERIKDFVYFNDFYIISALVIVILLWVIVKDIIFSA